MSSISGSVSEVRLGRWNPLRRLSRRLCAARRRRLLRDLDRRAAWAAQARAASTVAGWTATHRR